MSRFLSGYDVKMLKKMGRAIIDYAMIDENDTLLLAVSGGKDSLSLLDLLYKNQTHRVFPKKYNLAVFHVTLRETTSTHKKLEEYCNERNIQFYIKQSHLYEFILDKKKHKQNPCYLCAQIRRKWIFDMADKLKIKKIVFGHTLDDIVTSSLMNILFHRKCASERPKLSILNDKFTIIRPLAYIENEELAEYAVMHKLPIFESECTIGDNKIRKQTQSFINNLKKIYPNVKNNIFASFRNPAYEFFLDRDFNPSDHKGKKFRP